MLLKKRFKKSINFDADHRIGTEDAVRESDETRQQVKDRKAARRDNNAILRDPEQVYKHERL